MASFVGGYHYCDLKWKAQSQDSYVKHVEEVGKLQAELEKAKSDAKDQENKLRTALHDGSLRMFVDVKTPASSAGAPKERTELDPAFAESLLSIAEDGDNAIRELNMCIDVYNTARTK